jgi:hypothetical protein
VWGGQLPGTAGYSGVGYRYDPLTDAWTGFSSVDAPAARAFHVMMSRPGAFWVWGGFGAAGFLGDGAEYGVEAAQWFPVPSTGAPSARAGHVAAWTGSRWVVWGGHNGAGLLADGGQYDPVARTWIPLPVQGAPSARTGARAVWAGDRWLIWGGEGESGFLGDGAQLRVDPQGVALSWQPMSTLGAPAARREHGMVWTGSELVVWGGQTSGGLAGDGARYDPVMDQWQPLPTPGDALDPAARSGHSVTWTGNELLVFGGRTAQGLTATGAAWDLSSGEWRPLPSRGADPVAREGALSLWIDGEWLLVAGDTEGQGVAPPRRLDPQPDWHLFRKP